MLFVSVANFPALLMIVDQRPKTYQDHQGGNKNKDFIKK